MEATLNSTTDPENNTPADHDESPTDADRAEPGEHGEEHHPRRGRRGPRGPGGPGGPGGPRGRRGGGRPGGGPHHDLPPAQDAAAWFAGRLPEGLFTRAPSVSVDREEIVVIGDIPAPQLADGADPADHDAAVNGRIARFREETREQRMAVAQQAQQRYARNVAWGARIGQTEVVFSNLAAPVMTRLRQSERQVLDTLVDAGVARSRSDALGWAVRLVGEHTDEWLGELRQAMTEVNNLRDQGPDL